MEEIGRIDLCDEKHMHGDIAERVSAMMPDEDALTALSELYKAFGDVTRLRILTALLEAELCVCDISETLDMTVSAISHQLRLLRQARLVKSRREGRTVYYALSDEHVVTMLAQGLRHITEKER